MTPDPSSLPLALKVTFMVLAMVGNGIAVLMNTAMNSVNRSKIRQMATEENEVAIRLGNLLALPTDYRFTNRLLSYIFIVIGVYFALALPQHPILSALVYVTATITFSEYFTRKLAQQHSESIAMKLSVILTFIADVFLKMFRQETKIEYSGYSEEQVMSILESGQQSGAIKEEGKKMINSIFQFDDELAYEIMTPRTDVFLIDINDSTDEYLDELMELRYSRIPVCEDDTDNIIGILHIKDYLIKARETGFDKVDIRSILRKPYFVPETKNIDALFFELQIEKQHIAILIDEYGGFSGIVTMEDIVEEIVGDIEDEYDEQGHVITETFISVTFLKRSISIWNLKTARPSEALSLIFWEKFRKKVMKTGRLSLKTTSLRFSP